MAYETPVTREFDGDNALYLKLTNLASSELARFGLKLVENDSNVQKAFYNHDSGTSILVRRDPSLVNSNYKAKPRAKMIGPADKIQDVRTSLESVTNFSLTEINNEAIITA